MPRRSRFDTDEPTFPVSVVLAGIIWVVFGLLVGTGISVNFIRKLDDPNFGLSPPKLAFQAGFGLVGLIYVLVGVQAVRGQLSGLIAATIGSIVFGLFYCGVGVVLFASAGKGQQFAAEGQGNADGLMMLLGFGFGMFGVAMFSAALFALIGLSNYHHWREANGLAERTIRRRNDDDFDDRPSRRRRDDDYDNRPPSRRGNNEAVERVNPVRDDRPTRANRVRKSEGQRD